MDAATWVAISVAGLTAVGLVFERLDRRHEHRLAREQVDLLRQQVEAEAAARLEHSKGGGQKARLIATPGAINGGEREDTYHFTVTNAGPAAVYDLRAWAAGGGRGTPIMSVVTRIADVLLAQSVTGFVVCIPREASDAGGLHLWAAWTDDAGEQMEPWLALSPVR